MTRVLTHILTSDKLKTAKDIFQVCSILQHKVEYIVSQTAYPRLYSMFVIHIYLCIMMNAAKRFEKVKLLSI